MRALVVYQTVLGHTGTLSHAVAEGLSEYVKTDVLSLEEAPTHIGRDVVLLVIGGPKVAFGAPGGQEDFPLSVRDWTLGVKAAGVIAAVFDVNFEIDDDRITPEIVAASDRLLSGRGFYVEERASFWIEAGSDGLLAVDEIKRAREWGVFLGRKVSRETAG